jgi:acetylglutamate kinase
MREPPASTAQQWLEQHPAQRESVRGVLFVVKVGGSIQDDPGQVGAVMADAAALARAGGRVVVVHGGGKAITAAMGAAGLPARFVQGQRYTDAATLEVVERVLVGEVNAQLCAAVEAAGARGVACAPPLRPVLAGRRSPADNGEDLGLVGRVEASGVEVARLRALLDEGVVPVVAPVALDLDSPGGRLNVNADLAAGAVAAAMVPRSFVLVSDTAGVRADPAKPESALERMTGEDVARLRASGAISGGMMPKIEACLMGVRAGVAAVSIVDGRRPLALVKAACAGVGGSGGGASWRGVIDGTWVCA